MEQKGFYTSTGGKIPGRMFSLSLFLRASTFCFPIKLCWDLDAVLFPPSVVEVVWKLVFEGMPPSRRNDEAAASRRHRSRHDLMAPSKSPVKVGVRGVIRTIFFFSCWWRSCDHMYQADEIVMDSDIGLLLDRPSLRREVLFKTWTGFGRISALGRFDALQGVARRSTPANCWIITPKGWVFSDVASYSLLILLEYSISIAGRFFKAKPIFQSFQTMLWIIYPSVMLYMVYWDCMADIIFWCQRSGWLSRGNWLSRELLVQ